MEHIDIILFALFVIAVIIIAYIAFDYVKFTKSYCEQPEDKTGLYDFIHIKDNIINVDHIVNIRQVQSVKDENYKIIIELDDNKEPIFFDFDDDWEECKDVYEQIQMALDSANIITD
jgi:hypothetical protein